MSLMRQGQKKAGVDEKKFWSHRSFEARESFSLFTYHETLNFTGGLEVSETNASLLSQTCFEVELEEKAERLPDLSLVEACSTGDSKTAMSLIKNELVSVHAEDPYDGYQALHWAADNGLFDITRALMSKGANLNATNIFNGTPLQYASARGDSKIIEAFLNGGANVNHKDIRGRSPIHFACKMGLRDIALQLIRGGADPFQLDHEGVLPLTEYNIWKMQEENSDIVDEATQAIIREYYWSRRKNFVIFLTSLKDEQFAPMSGTGSSGGRGLLNAVFSSRDIFILVASYL